MSRIDLPERIIKDSTETLSSYPPILAQATGTPTVRIGTPAVSMPDAGSNATVDSFSTTLSAGADAGDTEMTIASATTVRGRGYLVTPANGEVFAVTAAKSATGTTMYLEEPLPVAVPVNATVSGWRISIALTADQTAELGAAIAEWTAVLGGVTEVWAAPFRIVERAGDYTLNGDTLTRSSPYARHRKLDNDSNYSEAIDAAWRLFIRPALLGQKIRPEMILSQQELEPAHIAAVEHYLAQALEDDATKREEMKRALADALATLWQSRELWVTDETEVIAAPDPAAIPLYGFTRISR